MEADAHGCIRNNPAIHPSSGAPLSINLQADDSAHRLLTKMIQERDSETQRQFRGASSTPGVSLEISPFSRRGERRKITAATAHSANSYKRPSCHNGRGPQ